MLHRIIPAIFCAALWLIDAQNPPAPQAPATQPNVTGRIAYGRQDAPTNYILGPDDQITIQAPDVEEITKQPVRIDMRGNINLPMVGRLQAAGLTADALEEQIKLRLKKYLQEPDVTVAITEFRSQPISIIGAVQTPGVHQLQGRKTLFEVLSTAGGLRADAGYRIRITRRLEWGRIPLPDAVDDPTGQFSIASVNVKSIMDATNPAENIAVKPEDVISVPKADIIYVMGAVKKSGGFVLGDSETLSTLQVLALAEGFERFADTQHARIMRPVPGNAKRTEVPVDLKKLIAGKTPDVQLKADDILFIPTSAKKAAAVRGVETALGVGTSVSTGLIIYRR
jgi:polysaccharide biosynthesis/export protein